VLLEELSGRASHLCWRCSAFASRRRRRKPFLQGCLDRNGADSCGPSRFGAPGGRRKSRRSAGSLSPSQSPNRAGGALRTRARSRRESFSSRAGLTRVRRADTRIPKIGPATVADISRRFSDPCLSSRLFLDTTARLLTAVARNGPRGLRAVGDERPLVASSPDPRPAPKQRGPSERVELYTTHDRIRHTLAWAECRRTKRRRPNRAMVGDAGVRETRRRSERLRSLRRRREHGRLDPGGWLRLTRPRRRLAF